MKLLIVEDNSDLNSALVSGFKSHGFAVDSSLDGKDGLQKSRVNDYDLIVLDINLPGASGLEVVEKIRIENSEVPIIALTARDSLENKLEGFSHGFDDYVTKPFDFLELLARVNAFIRRAKPNGSMRLEVRDIKLDSGTREAYKSGKQVKLTKIEFNILEYLLRNKGLVITNAELVEHIWQEDADLLDPPIRSHIKNLRKKIGDNDFTIIQTIPGVGYKVA